MNNNIKIIETKEKEQGSDRRGGEEKVWEVTLEHCRKRVSQPVEKRFAVYRQLLYI
jgi:hypothetical protein